MLHPNGDAHTSSEQNTLCTVVTTSIRPGFTIRIGLSFSLMQEYDVDEGTQLQSAPPGGKSRPALSARLHVQDLKSTTSNKPQGGFSKRQNKPVINPNKMPL